MVAYSFKAQFIDPIQSGEKRLTIRGYRKCHAKPGEPIQLYTAMRTRQCRKILTRDPICTRIRHINIAIGDPMRPVPVIELDGIILSTEEAERFAEADGFRATASIPATAMLNAFWTLNYPDVWHFSGVVIEWRPQV